MKKILLVTRPIAPPWDEASKNFAFYLAKNCPGFEFGLLTNGLLPDLPENILQKPIYRSNHFGFCQKLRSVFFQFKSRKDFDIRHYFFTPTKLNSFLIKHFLRSPQSKTIQTVATLREDLWSDEDLKKLLFGDWIIVYSDYAENKLRRLGFSNVERIYPGIDLTEYRKKEKNPELSKKYGFSPSDFIINFTGEYTRLGALDDVLESFIRMSAAAPEAKLSLALRIKNSRDARKKQAVIKKLESVGALGKVAFHDDGNYRMSDIYNLSDVSLFPVRDMKGKFDIPLAVVEAMACEKPVILSDLPVLDELGKSGGSVRIKAGDVPMLTDAVLDLKNQPEKRAAIGRKARIFAEENFDIRIIAEKYGKIYERL